MSRPSPTQSAIDFPDKVKEGNDKNMYVSKSDKNGIYKWKKIVNKKTAEEFYNQYPEIYLDKKFKKYNIKPLFKTLEKIKIELEKNHIYLFFIPWKKTGNIVDSAWSEAQDEILKKKNIDPSPLKNNFLFYMESDLFYSQKKGELTLQWNLDKKALDTLSDICKTYFGEKYFRPKNKTKSIIIKL
jgi:hypothetical protein